MQTGSKYLTLREAADKMRVSEMWILHHLREIPHKRLGDRYTFRAEDIQDYLDRHTLTPMWGRHYRPRFSNSRGRW
jgi:excisionase family DNA binding protein